MELNETISNSITNGISNQAYVPGFNCETVTYKKVHYFEHMEFSENIFEGVL